MKRTSLLEPLVSLGKGKANSTEAGIGLNLVLLYEDTETRKWVREIYQQLTKKAGGQAVRAIWWKLSELSAPGVLAGAVSTALRADRIVVCTRAAEGLPLPFYVWVEAWLPHRAPGVGELIALLGVPRPPCPPSGRVREYLRAVANQSRMRFVLEERTLADEPESTDYLTAEQREQEFRPRG